MTSSIDPKQFWDNKILAWEDGRYGQRATHGSLLENLADLASNSLRFRLVITIELLKPHIEGKHIVELGCGSGLLGEGLIAMGAASYRGYDISGNAVSHARELTAEKGLGEKVAFEVCSVADLPNLNTDIIFSLGLLDWLDDTALARVFEVGGKADFLHSISEKRAEMSQYLHRLYVFLAYGWRTGSYVPQYYTVAKIKRLATHHHQRRLYIYRNSKLRFGTLVTTLPIDVQS